MNNPISHLATQARSLRSIARSGIVDFRRPDHAAQAAYDTRTYGPLAAPVRAAARRFPNRAAVRDDTGSLTYSELNRTSRHLAAALRTRGCGPDSVVALLCRDRIGLVQAMVAAGMTGARVVLLNTGMSATQTADVCAREGVTVLCHDAEFTAAADAAAPELRVVVHRDPGAPRVAGELLLADLIGEGRRSPPAPRPARPGRLVLLTSGTTGLPKGAARRVSSPLDAAGLLERIPLPVAGVTVYAAPMFHGTGLSQFLLSVSLGNTNILRPSFDPQTTMALIDRYHATTVVLVPTMLQRMLAVPDADRYDTSSLHVIFCAGSTIPVGVGNAAIRRFGPVLYNLYGSSEVSVVSVATPQDWIAAPGTAGRPPSMVTVRLYDDGVPIAGPGRTGTIYAASSLMFEGYSGGGGKAMRDGLMSTGDVGHWDADGRLFVDGRDDDMIVSGGENVFPGEVEELLYAHPAVREAAVLGVADDEFGQRLAAVLVLESGAEFPPDEVRSYVKHRLARYKVPRDVHFTDVLPRTPSGKVIRRELLGLIGEGAG